MPVTCSYVESSAMGELEALTRDPALDRAAAAVVRRNAHSPADEHDLLDKLGLLPAQRRRP